MTAFALCVLLAGIAYLCLLTPALMLLYAHGEREAAMRDRAISSSTAAGLLLMIVITLIIVSTVLTFIINL